ncbi:transcriptional regulator, LysR family [Advenella mimigardefordensis DPN7]|uniref:Transcriptional regulator, LysR family n=2 Tax=Advenella mimigardefordensis TaxID=302406 RepID=W0PAT9_ADVMD|nr:transcriptional regulator, LysR family [Advenella mimigardefordensis DPN7]
MMTLQQLNDLLAVVSNGGYRAAARALNVSQAGLTKSLSRLEEEYGVSLLQRTAKGIVLTPEGEIFVDHARAILMETNRAEEWLHSLKNPIPVQVKLGVSIDPSLRLAPVVLKDFRAAFPDATIHLTRRAASELVAAIRDNRLDIAVTRIPDNLDSRDLRVDVLYKSSAVIVARKGHPLQYATSIHELAHCEWVVVGDPARSAQLDESVQELFLGQRLGRPRIAAVSDSLFGAMSMLLESDCVARLPVALLNHPLAAHSLSAINVKEQLQFHYEMGIIYKAGRRLSKEAVQLVSMLKSFSRLLQLS